MGCQEHDPTLVAQGLEDLHDALLGAHVDAAERLVQQNDAGLLRQCAGYEDPLTLAAGQLRYQGRALLPQTDPLQAGPDHLPVPLAGLAEPPDLAASAHRHHVHDGGGKDPVDAVALEDVRQAAALGRRAVQAHRALRDGQDPRNGVEQRALARAVRAQDAHQGAWTHVEGDIGQRSVPAALDGQVFDGYTRLGSHLRASTMRWTFVRTIST